MGNFLSPADRSLMRQALSDAFVDNDVDYANIAKRVSSFEPEVLEQIFFSEVAPVCHSNLETPVPPIWTAFDGQWLDMEIDKMLKGREQSYVLRQKDRLFVTYLKWRYSDLWQLITRGG
ncbi:hypothetical protein [Pseudomonas sp.]|uniref:DUF7079 family protein n=1 Tax=Pseudomonas sp. TaxID=306 RepID=UPI00299E787D|nr:hypothetical protein [Pseudomonas sp.]MDX1365934.1 hypothetical protein [Pseudomonas sp.]